ncbi:MAG: hypothetical protein ACLFNT_02075 [Spirochaetales bacterium]
MRRGVRQIILVASSLAVLVATVSLIGAAVAIRRTRSELHFGIEELDLLIEDQSYVEAASMIRWLAERFVNIGDGLRVYKRAYALYGITGSPELPAIVSDRLLTEFPGNTVARELAVFGAVLGDEPDRALSIARDGGKRTVRPDYYALALLSSDHQIDGVEDANAIEDLDGPLLLTTLDGASDPTQYDAAWQLTQDSRYAVNAALLYLGEGEFSRVEELMEHARIDTRAPLFAYDYYLSRGDYAAARRLAQATDGESLVGLLREADIALYTNRRDEAIRVYQEVANQQFVSPELLVNTAYLSSSRATRVSVFEEALSLYADEWPVVEQAVRFFAGFDMARAAEILEAQSVGPNSMQVEFLELRIASDPSARGYPARLWRLLERADDETMYRFAAWYFGAHGSAIDAEQVLQLSRQRFGRPSWVIDYEALLAADSGRWDDAASLFSESHEIIPDWRSAYNAGLAWHRAGWPERGEELLERARVLAPYSSDQVRSRVYTASARTSSQNGRIRDYLEQALEIEPGSPEALYLLRTLPDPGE